MIRNDLGYWKTLKFTTNKRKESVADVGNFEIAERRIDFGDADQRRKESGIYGPTKFHCWTAPSGHKRSSWLSIPGSDPVDPWKKSLSSYEVLGQTYFLVRDRIEKRRVYETGTRFTMNPVAEESPLINRIGSRTFK